MKKILLIEDGKTGVGPLIHDLKKLYNFEVYWITVVDDVFEILQRSPIDAIILDIMIPVPDSWTTEEKKEAEYGVSTGLVLYRKIRKIHNRIPILIYSAKSLKMNFDRFSVYRRKPELIEKIGSILIELMNKKR